MIVTEIMKLCKVIFSFFAKFDDFLKKMPKFYRIATKMFKVKQDNFQNLSISLNLIVFNYLTVLS